ncbi:MAG TPA: Eco57I restriction-modification methylase domain-containing protein [Candidatus Limnocylindrales bacterium]|nr:Eco57I restriction-modification methylase domain-containing protein [Candidatus Limnocylindrales bacterium]
MAENEPIRTTRGIQQSLIAPVDVAPPDPLVEPKGVVYTKRWVVELLLDLSGYEIHEDLVDTVAVEPSAGEGAFLIPMIERLVASTRKLKRPLTDCEGSLIAFELDHDSANRTRALAVRTLQALGVEAPLARQLAQTWVRSGDYLFEATDIGADFVIGNPPYIRLEDIPETTASMYRKYYRTMCGRADLYVAFFEAALQQLNRGGVCAFICADRWMRNQYGAALRDLITSDYAVDAVVEMHMRMRSKMRWTRIRRSRSFGARSSKKRSLRRLVLGPKTPRQVFCLQLCETVVFEARHRLGFEQPWLKRGLRVRNLGRATLRNNLEC